MCIILTSSFIHDISPVYYMRGHLSYDVLPLITITLTHWSTIYHCIISTHTSSVRYLGIWFSSICPHLWVELQITHFFLSAAVVATMFVTAVTAFSMMIFLGCFVISHSNSFWLFSVFCHLWGLLNISDFFLCAAAPSAVFATAMNISSMDII